MSEYLRLPGDLQGEYPIKDYCIHGHKYLVQPSKIFGNLYFVGDQDATVHLIDTGDGLILLDSGYPHMGAFLINSIWELGFKPADIKYLVHTHGHYDHYGSTNTIVALSGAKTFLSALDHKMLKEKDYDLASLNNVAYHSYASMFEVDVEINDGDVIELGNTAIKMVHTPGHTPGCMSVFFDAVDENKNVKRCGMHGGVGFNTLHFLYMHLFGNYDAHKEFIWGINRVYDEKVDILLGNHTAQNNTDGKIKAMCENPNGENPFIDPTQWQKFLDKVKNNFHEMVKYESSKFQPLLEYTKGWVGHE